LKAKISNETFGEMAMIMICGGRFIFKKEEQHAKKAHRQPVTRCRQCGMEFLHEEDRLHHVQQEKERKIDRRRHK
jgi:hypothetical protein